MRKTLFTIVAVVTIALLAACNFHAEKNERGGTKSAEINTPVGNLNVRTQGVEGRDTGLPVYANAKEKPGNKEDDKANVNINTPFFGLKVVAVKYVSDDSPDKVLNWYRDKLKGMSNFVECKPGSGDGEKKGSGDDLDRPVQCEHNKNVKIGDDEMKNAVELKTGTQGDQRIVAVESYGSGTQIALVHVRIHKGGKDSI